MDSLKQNKNIYLVVPIVSASMALASMSSIRDNFKRGGGDLASIGKTMWN